MRVVVSAVLVAFIGVGLYLFYQKLPVINQLSECYRAALTAVDDKHIFARKAHTTEAAICGQRKTGLVPALNCFVAVEDNYAGSESEISWYKSVAKLMTRSPQTIEEIVDKHNQECGFADTKVEYDSIRKQWF